MNYSVRIRGVFLWEGKVVTGVPVAVVPTYIGAMSLAGRIRKGLMKSKGYLRGCTNVYVKPTAMPLRPLIEKPAHGTDVAPFFAE